MKNRAAFTILEAIVLFVLVLIAAALLFPLFQARHRRGTEVCQANLKSITLSIKQYVQDWDDRLPLTTNSSPVRMMGNGWINATAPYMRTTQVLHCPAGAVPVAGMTDYALNAAVAGVNETRLRNLSSTVLLCEINQSSGLMATATAPQAIDRHQDGSNYAFEDGHIKWMQSLHPPAPANVPATVGNLTFGR